MRKHIIQTLTFVFCLLWLRISTQNSNELMKSKDFGIKPNGFQLFGAPDPTTFKIVNTIDTEILIEEILPKIKNIKVEPSKEKQGIVILGYNNVIYELLALVNYLKEYTSLKIELFYADDIDDKYMNLLKKFDIKIINLAQHELYQKKVSNERRYYLKPLAMLSTSFEEFVYLDSDCFPLLHSVDVFAKVFHYLESVDSVFFRDYWMMTPENPMYRLLNIPYTLQRQVDSSVIVMRKSKNIETLILSYYICLEPHFDYYLFGDKDAYWFSALLIRIHLPELSAPIISINPDMSGYIGNQDCGVGMMHLIDGLPAFAHLNGFKSRLENGLPKQKLVFCERDTIDDAIPTSRISSYTIGVNGKGSFEDDGTQSYSLFDDHGQCVISQSSSHTIDIDSSPIIQKYEYSFHLLKSTCQ
eukprot:NODE_649_length_5036_cov_1.140571.p1 type:complete len:414 gc:universal NODE_649_length_5036_cov_1.140571:3639-2398(-)